MYPFSKLWAILFLPFTLIYSVSSAVKNFLYDSKFLTPKKVNVPVISIGNLTMGGTGKTPVVAFIANELSERGYKVGIVSRGYGRLSKGTIWVARNGEVLATAKEGGDEPVELASSIKNVSVVVANTRFAAATELLSKIKVDIILVDDGMQHRKFHRDFEIVVQDVKSASGWKFQLPSGVFRESWKNVKRADMVIWTKWNNSINKNKFSASKTNPDQSHFWGEFCPKDFYFPKENRSIELSNLKGERAVVFCGIGQPENFKTDLEKLGIVVEEFRIFKDHHVYADQDIKAIISSFHDHRNPWILTTAKDFYRLESEKKSQDFVQNFPLLYLRGSMNLTEGKEEFVGTIIKRVLVTK